MPDSETFKLILNGGSFGLLAVGVVWLLFWGSPMLRDTLAKMSADHAAVVGGMAAEHREAIATLTAACREDSQAHFVWMAEQWAKRDGVVERLTAAIDRLGTRRGE